MQESGEKCERLPAQPGRELKWSDVKSSPFPRAGSWQLMDEDAQAAPFRGQERD